jgi:hypothetical protein
MPGNVLLLNMNESSGIIHNCSGKENHGTVHGGVTYGVSGKFNTALRFDGAYCPAASNVLINFDE